MKGMVIYKSKYGNCEQIARSLSRGLQETGADVTVMEVGSAGEIGADVDFIALGSPTRIGRAMGPVRRFIETIQGGTDSKLRFVAFGTGLAKGIAKGEQISAEDIHQSLEAKGLQPLAQPFKASVTGWKGPLVEGEVERAYEYGKTVIYLLDQPSHETQ
jgi:flavorubredoxin